MNVSSILEFLKHWRKANDTEPRFSREDQIWKATGKLSSKCKVWNVQLITYSKTVKSFWYIYYQRFFAKNSKWNHTFFISVAVIVCFLLCRTPYHALRIVFVITSKNGLRNQKLLEVEETLYLISGNFFEIIFAYGNQCPLIWSSIYKLRYINFYDM